MKRLICLLLAFCLLLSLSACAAPEPEADAPAQKPGRWVEEEVEVPTPASAKSCQFFGHDDTLDVVFYNETHTVEGWSRSTDLGESWQSLDVSFLDGPKAEYTDAYSNPYCDFRVGENGEVWFSMRRWNSLYSPVYYTSSGPFVSTKTYDISDPEGAEKIKEFEVTSAPGYYLPSFYHLENGEAIRVPFDFPEDEHPVMIMNSAAWQLSDFYPLADGGCLFANDGVVIKVDLNGARTGQINVWDETGGCSLPVFCQKYGNQVLLAGNQAALADLENQTAVSLPFTTYGAWGLDAGGAAYGISGQSIERVALGSTLTEELAAGEDYYFGGTSNVFSALMPVGDYLFAVINNRLFKYHYDADALPAVKNVMTVFSMHDNFAVRQAIAQLRLTAPEWDVVYRIGDEERGDAVSAEDFIKSLHTELLAGTGPDVLILDDMAPLDSYLESGVLTDLTGLVDTSGLYPNLLETGRYQEGLYAIPAGFGFPAITSFYTNVEWLFDGGDPSNFLDFAFEGSFPVYATLPQLLQRSKEFSEMDIKYSSNSGRTFKKVYLLDPYVYHCAAAVYAAVLPDLTIKDPDALQKNVKELLNRMDWMDPTYDGQNTPSPVALLNAKYLAGSTKSDLEPLNAYLQVSPLPSITGKKAYLPYTLAAIPQKKTPCDGAAAFINALLSPEVQARLYTPPEHEGSASLFSIFDQNCMIPLREDCLTLARYHETGADEDMRKAIHSAALLLDTPVYVSQERAQLFYDTVCGYLQGALTPDEAAKQIIDSFSREETLYALETGG